MGKRHLVNILNANDVLCVIYFQTRCQAMKIHKQHFHNINMSVVDSVCVCVVARATKENKPLQTISAVESR